MLTRFRQARPKLVIATLYALAMALLGFAHQPIDFHKAATPDLAAYALPDGTIPTLCGDFSGGGDQSHQNAAAHVCDACALTAAAGLLCAPPTIAFSVDFTVLARLPEAQGEMRPAGLRVSTARGPPASQAT